MKNLLKMAIRFEQYKFMSAKTKTIIIFSFIVVAFLAPRLALLQNGLDHQRMWDTNTPAAFHFLEAIKNGRLFDFYSQIQKYPLFGSYTYVPVISLYYLGNYLIGIYDSPADFINAYALSETNIFFWIRLQMLFLNSLAVFLLYLLVKKFTDNSSKAGLYAMSLVSANFIVTIFSVEPRIHSLAFLTTVLVLYFSFVLLQKKGIRNYLIVFGVAAAAAAISQSSFITFFLPFLAHFYDSDLQRWTVKDAVIHRIKPLIMGIVTFAVITISVGYPAILFSLVQSPNNFFEPLISQEHTQPTFGIDNLFRFSRQYFFSIDLLSTVVIVILLVGLLAHRRKIKWRIDQYDVLTLAHIGIFFVVFGPSNVINGRFMLVVLPSFFFLLARIMNQFDYKIWAKCFFILVLVFQLYGIFSLTRIGLKGDTREKTTQFILANSQVSDAVLSNLDSHLLGIVPASDTIQSGVSGARGTTDQIIAAKGLSGRKTRPFIFWNLKEENWSTVNFNNFRYVIISHEQKEEVERTELLLKERGLELLKQFKAQNDSVVESYSFLPWDVITPLSRLPLPLALRTFQFMGPTISVYARKN